MATYFVAAGGSNTSPYDTWAKAATSLQTALTAATADNDIVVIQHDGVPSTDSAMSGNTAYTIQGSIALIAASADDAATAYTPTPMGTANHIGSSSASRQITITSAADKRIYIYGLTLRNAGTGDANTSITGSLGAQFVMDQCYFWLGTTGSSARLVFGNAGSGPEIELRGCTWRFGATGQRLRFNSTTCLDCVLSADGSAPSTLIDHTGELRGTAVLVGCDISHCTGTIVGNSNHNNLAILERCKIGASVIPLAAQTSNPTRASAAVLLLDCASGNTQGFFGYYDALGQVTSETGIYFTSGAAAQSWKIVTSENASFWTPFKTPPIDLYHTGTSAITPYLEVLRDGSTTAYQDDEIWAEFAAKVTPSSTKASFYNDRKNIDTDVSAANQAAGAGTGSWTGEAGSAWSGKIDSGSSFTPAVVGAISAVVYVGEPSITVYVDPQIRT